MVLFSGVILVLQPPFIFDKVEVLPTKENGNYYFGASMAFASSIAGGFHYVIVGRLLRNSTTNSALLLAFYGGFGGLLVLLPAVYLDDNQRFGNEDFAIDERSKEDGLDDEAVDIISAESTKKPTNVTTHGAY